MKRTFFNQRRILGAVTVLLVVACMLPAGWVGVLWHGPRVAVEMLVTPVSHPTRSIALKFVEQPQQDVETSESLRQQRDEYHRLAYKLQLELDHMRRLNQQLSQISQMNEGSGSLTFVSASVVAGSANFGQFTIRLNRGAKDGLGVGNVVIKGIQLVGRITDVGPLSATVALINMPQTNLQIRFAPAGPNIPRQVEAIVNIDKDAKYFEGEIDANQPVMVGDNAFLADNRWPPEAYIVGKVIAVEDSPKDPLLRRIVKVEPQIPLWSLSEVIIVVPKDKRDTP